VYGPRGYGYPQPVGLQPFPPEGEIIDIQERRHAMKSAVAIGQLALAITQHCDGDV